MKYTYPSIFYKLRFGTLVRPERNPENREAIFLILSYKTPGPTCLFAGARGLFGLFQNEILEKVAPLLLTWIFHCNGFMITEQGLDLNQISKIMKQL